MHSSLAWISGAFGDFSNFFELFFSYCHLLCFWETWTLDFAAVILVLFSAVCFWCSVLQGQMALTSWRAVCICSISCEWRKKCWAGGVCHSCSIKQLGGQYNSGWNRALFFLSNLFICYEPEKFSQNGRMLLLTCCCFTLNIPTQKLMYPGAAALSVLFRKLPFRCSPTLSVVFSSCI